VARYQLPATTAVEEGERTKLLLFLQGQSRVLEMIAQSTPLGAVLEELARVLEEQVDGFASILLLSEDRKHLCLGAAPNLPDSFRRAIDGSAVGPRAGSCGTAALLGRPVIVADISRDPLWVGYKTQALEAGFKACWSTAIVSRGGDVLGTFAMYHRDRFTPSSMHLSLIDLASNLARIAIERDAAERDRARLWDAERFADRYRMVLQATRDVVWEWDLANRDIHWNDGLTVFGYGAREAENTLDWWIEHIHPGEAERVREGVELAIDSGKPLWEEEYRFRRKNGTYADLFARGLIVRDETGKAVRIVGSLQDITRRKRHEMEAHQLAERLQSASVAAAVGTWRLDLKTEFFLADASLNRLVGKEERETVHRFSDALRVIHPEDRARVARALDESITTRCPYESEHRVVRADGEIRWVRSRGRVLYDPEIGGEVLTGATADLTEIKYAEQSMAILADASRLLAESLDVEQTLTSMAHMAVPSFSDVVLVHLKDEQTDTLRLSVVHAANPELLAILREMLRNGSFRVAAPSRRVTQTGCAELTPRWTSEWLLEQEVDEQIAALMHRFHISSIIHAPIMSGGHPFGVIVFATTGTRTYNTRDLAFAEELARRASHAMHHAQLFQAAKADRERAEEAAALRERLVAIVGHDLRNPLSAITVAATILSRAGLATRESGLVNQIQTSANRMSRMITQILDFARIRAGMSFELKFASANLHQLCRAVVEELGMSKPDQRIELNVQGDGEAICDADRLAQVISNLVGNAIQYGTRPPVTVTVRDAEPDGVAIAIHNFGPTIPADAQGSIFAPFRQESTAADERSKDSVGLGLFIASEIVRAHGGSIAVRSPDRDGTTFTVVLPRKPVIVSGGVAEPLLQAAVPPDS
jgi:PAS domain S-box-containing protein